jgi:hypothetical protein
MQPPTDCRTRTTRQSSQNPLMRVLQGNFSSYALISRVQTRSREVTTHRVGPVSWLLVPLALPVLAQHPR